MNNQEIDTIEETVKETIEETRNLDRYETADWRPSELTVFVD